jgi:hypothetical protein
MGPGKATEGERKQEKVASLLAAGACDFMARARSSRGR